MRQLVSEHNSHFDKTPPSYKDNYQLGRCMLQLTLAGQENVDTAKLHKECQLVQALHI